MLSQDDGGWIFALWFVFGPVALPILAIGVAYIALRNKRLFLYRTLLAASIIVFILPIYVLLSFTFGGLGKENQAGLIFVFLPFWDALIFVVLFGLCCAAYFLAKSQKDPQKHISLVKFDTALLSITLGELILYFVLWAVLYSKSGNTQ